MTTLVILLFVTLIIPLCGIAIWFVLANKRTDEWYEREIDKIYSRKRKK
jgi:hypothetical protein